MSRLEIEKHSLDKLGRQLRNLFSKAAQRERSGCHPSGHSVSIICRAALLKMRTLCASYSPSGIPGFQFHRSERFQGAGARYGDCDMEDASGGCQRRGCRTVAIEQLLGRWPPRTARAARRCACEARRFVGAALVTFVG